MSRSEDRVIVAAELSEMEHVVLVELLTPVVIQARHAANTLRGWLEWVRSEDPDGAFPRRLDELGLLE